MQTRLLDALRDIVLVIRPDGRIIEANEAAVQTYGYPRDELLSLSIRDLRAHGFTDSVAEQMSRAGSEGLLFETVHRKKDGSTFPVEVSSRGIDVSDGRVLVSAVRDISDRKRAELAL